MQDFIDEQLPINDLFTENLSLCLQSYDKKKVVIRCDSEDVFLNPYGFAHGGFLYTIGHIAARNMALVCLQRHMQVVQSTCQYLDRVTCAPITAEAKLLSIYHAAVVCEAKVMDGKGNVCFLQTLILQDTTNDGVTLRFPKKYEGQKGSKYAATGLMAGGQKISFDDICHIGSPYADKEGIHVSTDLYSDTSSDRGYVHQGVLFTMCDNCAAACVAMIQKKRPVTVSAAIHYLAPAIKGPITATGKLLRAGNKLTYYDIIVKDGTGRPCAKTQFIMNCTDWPPQVNGLLKKMGF
ncbi:MAG: PaaI family thioesterase [Oscillospiraceae bacterium]|nr:PaaI family thioesterase [Oscillospiraceae bacterium]